MGKILRNIGIGLLLVMSGFIIGLEVPLQDTSFKQIVYDISYAPLSNTIIMIGYTTAFTMIQMKMQDRKVKMMGEVMKKKKDA